jgi:hypothetical protein
MAKMGGITERQARFLVNVMLHAGVCVPRQYATFCGIVHGSRGKCRAPPVFRQVHAPRGA